MHIVADARMEEERKLEEERKDAGIHADINSSKKLDENNEHGIRKNSNSNINKLIDIQKTTTSSSSSSFVIGGGNLTAAEGGGGGENAFLSSNNNNSNYCAANTSPLSSNVINCSNNSNDTLSMNNNKNTNSNFSPPPSFSSSLPRFPHPPERPSTPPTPPPVAAHNFFNFFNKNSLADAFCPPNLYTNNRYVPSSSSAYVYRKTAEKEGMGEKDKNANTQPHFSSSYSSHQYHANYNANTNNSNNNNIFNIRNNSNNNLSNESNLCIYNEEEEERRKKIKNAKFKSAEEENEWMVVDKFSLANRNIQHNYSFEVSVSNPETRSSGPLGKYTLYLVAGKTSTGSSFSTRKRYSDFEWIRQQLVMALPGVFIPPIPKKQKLGRFSSHFVENRRKGLQMFLFRVFQNPFIANLCLFKTWLQRGEGGMESLKKEISTRALRDSLIEFKFIFNQILQNVLPSEIYADIFIKFKHYLHCNLSAIQSLYNLTSRLCSLRLMEKDVFRSLPFFFDEVRNTENIFLQNFENGENIFNTKNAITDSSSSSSALNLTRQNSINNTNTNNNNTAPPPPPSSPHPSSSSSSSSSFALSTNGRSPYISVPPTRIHLSMVFDVHEKKNEYFENFEILQNATARELEDTECMIEAANSIDRLICLKSQTQSLLEKQESTLRQTQLSNRGSWMQSIFFRKDKEAQIYDLHVHIEKLKQEIETLDEWIRLSKIVLVCNEIPAYMFAKLSEFERDAEEFCEKQKKWGENEMKIWSDFYIFLKNKKTKNETEYESNNMNNNNNVLCNNDNTNEHNNTDGSNNNNNNNTIINNYYSDSYISNENAHNDQEDLGGNIQNDTSNLSNENNSINNNNSNNNNNNSSIFSNDKSNAPANNEKQNMHNVVYTSSDAGEANYPYANEGESSFTRSTQQ